MYMNSQPFTTTDARLVQIAQRREMQRRRDRRKQERRYRMIEKGYLYLSDPYLIVILAAWGVPE